MTKLLSPFELKHLRKAIGATLPRMAQLLGLLTTDTNRLKTMENGDAPIPGSIQRIARYMQEGVVIGDMAKELPEYMICDGLDAREGKGVEWVMHTRYPRFLAVITDDPVEGLACSSADGIEWLSVALWIDEPVGDGKQWLDEAAKQFAEYTSDSL